MAAEVGDEWTEGSGVLAEGLEIEPEIAVITGFVEEVSAPSGG